MIGRPAGVTRTIGTSEVRGSARLTAEGAGEGRLAGRIRDADVALVRDRSPIAEIISEHVQLRQVGGGALKGLCPFHDEKTPSFNVRPANGTYHCFGCGVGGDVIAFVRELDG